MSLTNIHNAFDYNNRVNSAYKDDATPANKPLFQVFTRDEGNGTATSGTRLWYDVPQDGNGKADLNALETWANGRILGLSKIYGQYGTYDIIGGGVFSNAEWTNGDFITVYDGTNFRTDANGSLLLESKVDYFVGNTVQQAFNEDPFNAVDYSLSFTTFSFFIRHKIQDRTGAQRLFTTTTDDNDCLLTAEKSPSFTSLNEGFGTLSYYLNGVDPAWSNREEVFLDLVTELKNVGITGGTLPTNTNPVYIFQGRVGFQWNGDFQTILIYDADVSGEIASINTLMDDLNTISPTVSGTVKDAQDALIEGAKTIWLSVPDVLGDGAIAEQVLSDPQGVHALDSALYDATKGWWGFTRFAEVVESGTATGGTTTTLEDTNKNWTADEHVTAEGNRMIKFTSGLNDTLERQITTNGATELTLNYALPNPVANGDTYEIWEIKAEPTQYYPPTADA